MTSNPEPIQQVMSAGDVEWVGVRARDGLFGEYQSGVILDLITTLLSEQACLTAALAENERLRRVEQLARDLVESNNEAGWWSRAQWDLEDFLNAKEQAT